ncbi:hypothetical protein Vretifemale_12168 [Volvox reticuliferus]|uniref:Amino acid transporter n=1 Tax=Volvox reticuliferus TaxID=1737510 RepID=A0A8J4CIV1_9CHLO|nr:hypothetical protein Vretifemale_12168 [Volvox reticuliferus]
MRTLKMLVLPLITASVMAGVCALRQSTADMGKVARYTLLYYFTTTMGAVVLGIVIVNIIKVRVGVGVRKQQTHGSDGHPPFLPPCISPVAALRSTSLMSAKGAATPPISRRWPAIRAVRGNTAVRWRPFWGS